MTQAIRTSLADHLGQLGLINISTAASGDPGVERRIVEQVASYGRQLGWLLDAVDVLVRERRGEPPRAGDEAALEQVEQLRGEVEALKARAVGERSELLVADVRALLADADANAETIAALRAVLAERWVRGAAPAPRRSAGRRAAWRVRPRRRKLTRNLVVYTPGSRGRHAGSARRRCRP